MNPILKRRLAALNYQDPEELLRRLMPTIVGILQKPETVAHLSAKQKKEFLEEHQAAFLAFMMKHMAGRHGKITVCVEELDDFDCVIKGEIGNDTVYKPVQLKHLPSHEVNAAIELQGIIDPLKTKYPTSSDLVVAIWINRDIKLDFRPLRLDGLSIEQLWFFGDAVTGEITLDGGIVADLVDGICWSGFMKGGMPAVRPIRFKPKADTMTEETGPDKRHVVNTFGQNLSEPIEDAEVIANQITLEGRWEATARKHTCLLGWNAGQLLPEPLADNGTCCLIQTRVRRFVVTCEHVWRGYEAFRNATAVTRLWISLVRDDQGSAPSDALVLSNPQVIAADKSRDLAVFTFDEIDTLEPWRFWQFRLTTASKANKGDIVHFLGFPGEAIRAGATNRILNYCYSSRVIHDVGYNKFVLHSAPGTMHHENQQGEDSAAFRICGASGAPVFKVGQDLNLSLAGVISDLSSSGCGSATRPYEMSDGDIYVTHACFIQEDGSIVPP